MGWGNSKTRLKGWVLGAVCALGLVAPGAKAVQVVSESAELACREYEISRELRVYKDPSLFLGNLVDILRDRERGMKLLFQETPLLTTLTGRVQLMRLAPPRLFKNFGAVARLYEVAEPRLRPSVPNSSGAPVARPMEIVPVQVCGDHSAYTDTLGFVLLADLENAERSQNIAGGMPPSTPGNPIPNFPPAHE